MIDERWLGLINYCKEHPFMTIERLEIANGVPVLVVKKERLTETTMAYVKIKL